MNGQELIRGRDEICRYLSLPWPTVARLATAGGLPIKNIAGDLPSLAVADLEAWQRADFTGRCGDETSAQA